MNEDTIYKVRYSKITMHKVRKGDSIQKIAKLYKTDPLDIAFINRIPKPYYLKIGRTLYIPQT
jgi:LysM repeat protein